MRMNRRNVLLGLGTVVAGGGAALGTGAFSSVVAERTINVEVADDSAAFLGLEDLTDGEYITEENGVLEIDIGETDGVGVNKDAVTTFDELIKITNNSSTDVTSISFSFESDTEGSTPGNVISVNPDGFSAGMFPEEENSGDADLLEEGESVTIGLEIDLRDPGDESDLDGATLTITAGTS